MMPHWLIKSAIQRAISLLPASQTWNSLFQQNVTRSLELTESRFEARLDYCRLHLEHFLELQPQRARDFTALEVGTGWYRVVPVGLYLCGADFVARRQSLRDVSPSEPSQFPRLRDSGGPPRAARRRGAHFRTANS